jgi:hypothetical protein
MDGIANRLAPIALAFNQEVADQHAVQKQVLLEESEVTLIGVDPL